jgi:hypothetical protein
MADITSIVFEGDDTPGTPGGNIKQALDDALANRHQLSPEVLAIEGMSGQIYRKFINNLIKSTDNARYLEVGNLKGSTACAAMYNNTLTITCIDNWHWPEHQPDFIKNTNSVRTDNINFTAITSDFRAVDYSKLGKFNVYLFDGPHSEDDQYRGVVAAREALDDKFILIVDDWNWADVQRGTWRGIKDLGYTVVSKLEVLTTDDHSYPKVADHFSDWHNGYLVAYIEK